MMTSMRTYVPITTAGRGAFSRSSSHATSGDRTKASSHARKRMIRIEAKPPSSPMTRSASSSAK